MNKFLEYYKLGLVKKVRSLSKEEQKALLALSVKDRPKNIIDIGTMGTYDFYEILEIASKDECEEQYQLLKFKNEKGKTATVIYIGKFFKLAYYLTIITIVIYVLFFIFMILPNLV